MNGLSLLSSHFQGSVILLLWYCIMLIKKYYGQFYQIVVNLRLTSWPVLQTSDVKVSKIFGIDTFAKSIAGLHPKIIITFSQFSAHPLQDRQYAICYSFIIRCLFLPTTIWASIYPPADALLY